MTGEKNLFMDLKPKSRGDVTFGDNSKGQIEGIGSIGNMSSTFIENVLLVNGLKHNLLSISQLCDKGFKVVFECMNCHVIDVKTNKIIFFGHRHGNVYVVFLNDLSFSNVCLMTKKEDESWMWHRRLGHASMHVTSKLCKNDLVVGLPKLSFDFDKICDACVKGKHKKSAFKPKNCVSTYKLLQLLHIDLFGPTRIMSLGGKCWVL